MIGKQLANVLTRCFSSHPWGESEARCQNMHLLIYTCTLKDAHDQRLEHGSCQPLPPIFSWWRSSSLAHSGWACYLQESSGCIASPSEPAQYLLSPGPALLPRSRNIAKLFSDHKVVHIESSISFYSHNIEISLYRSYNFALTIVRHHRVKFLRVSTLYHTAYINALCIFRGHGKIFMALPSLVTNIVNERCLLLPHAWHLLSIHLLFVTEDVIIRGPSTSIANKSI